MHDYLIIDAQMEHIYTSYIECLCMQVKRMYFSVLVERYWSEHLKAIMLAYLRTARQVCYQVVPMLFLTRLVNFFFDSEQYIFLNVSSHMLVSYDQYTSLFVVINYFYVIFVCFYF